ncbi:hypothetical protein DM860_015816 [Cuscuta australis]|uniref:Pectinesterase inhibitor domain-containing protein n=1 Tax=Cuscuta australis TaxID=267555 RepID=A0A328E216_9ASTE|nr:hypothetical protein DM860_015816 [Cuscuta australis]
MKLFLVCFFVLSFQQLAAAVSVKAACAQTKSPGLCASVIGSDPRRASGDLRVFSAIALGKALSEGNGLKRRCPTAYAGMVNDVGEAIRKLKERQIVTSVDESIEKGINAVNGCRESRAGDLVILLNIARDVLKILN